MFSKRLEETLSQYPGVRVQDLLVQPEPPTRARGEQHETPSRIEVRSRDNSRDEQ